MFVNFNILNQLGSPAINSNTFANRPAAGQTGRLFVSIDTFEIYRDNGTSWDLIGGPGTSTITGSGTATQVAYFTGTNAIGSSANLFWDNTNGYLGVGTATPGARIEAVKTDGYGIYANYTTSAGSGATTTGIYSINNTAGSGYAAVIEERTGNTTGGQYPLLVKHSLSSGTAAVGNGTGLQFQLQDDAGTFKTTQLTIETIDATAANYASRYRFNVQSAGSSTPAAYLNATGLGLGTATPGAKLDIHSTGTLAQLNSTGATNNGYLAFQRAGTTTFSIGDTYNGGSNYFRIYSNTLAADVAQIFEATGKTNWQATQTYTTGLARGNYFDYNVSVAAGGSFSSPNSISAVGTTLDLTLAGNATIPSGARSGLDAYNTVSFTGTGTLTHSQGTQIRAYSNLTTGWAFAGSATGTITHLAGLRVLFPDNSGSAVTITNNYGLLINDQTANTGTVTYTNRWGIYQEGASDLNYFAANMLLGSTTNSGEKLQVTGNAKTTGTLQGVSGVFSGNGSSATTMGGTNAAASGLTDKDLTLSAWYPTSGTNEYGGDLYLAAGRPTGGGSGKYGTVYIQAGVGSATANAVGSIATVIEAANTYIDFKTSSSLNTAASSKMYLNGSGNLGIGTSTPASILDLNTSNNTTITTNSTNSGGFTSLQINASSVAKALIGYGTYLVTGGGLGFRTAAGVPISFAIGGATEALFVSTGSNVLIGKTTDSGEKLQINGNSYTANNIFQGSALASASYTAQRVVGSTTAGASGVAKKIIYCSFSAAINVKVYAYQSGSNSGSIVQDFAIAYGASTAGTATSQIVNNVTAISLAYNNGGSPTYTIDCTVTYTGAAPTLYIVVDGIAYANMSIL